MNTEASSRLLDRVHKLLAKAEDESVTPPEAQALTAKAAELMAKYGIDRALLAADRPETDRPASRMLDIDNPWARVKAHLLCGLGSALRCQCILLPGARPGARIHIFGYASDIERTDVLYASVLIQMWHGLAGAQVPAWSRSPRAWRRAPGRSRRWRSRAASCAARPGGCGTRRAPGRRPAHATSGSAPTRTARPCARYRTRSRRCGSGCPAARRTAGCTGSAARSRARTAGAP